MRRRSLWLMGLVLLVALPRAALAREATLAVVNIGAPSGASLSGRAATTLQDSLGGLARHPGVAAYLAGSGASGEGSRGAAKAGEGSRGAAKASGLPAGEAGKEIAALVERARTRSAAPGELGSLGRLLGVDYLLLVLVRGHGYSARLFSVHRLAYSPDTLESSVGDTTELRPYLRQQTRPAKSSVKSFLRRWWIVGLIAVVSGVTLGVALGTRSSDTGDLRIRATR
jgi:hypothetical protein